MFSFSVWQTEDGLTLRKAIQIAKQMPFQVSIMPASTGSLEEQRTEINDTEQSEAYGQLQEIGRDRWPTASEAQQFARAMTENPALAQKAHRRPGASDYMKFPRS